MTIPSDPGAAIADDNTTYILNQGATGLAQRYANLYNMFNGAIGHDNILLSDAFDWTGIHTYQSTKLHILSSGAAFDLIFAVATVFTADRTLTLDLGDASRALTLGGDLTTAAAFTTSGANALTLTTTGDTNVTLPTSGTLSRVDGFTESIYSTASIDLENTDDAGFEDVDAVNAKITFTVNQTGRYQVDFYFSHYQELGAAANKSANTSFRLTDGSSNSSPVMNSLAATDAGTVPLNSSIKTTVVSHVFNFASTGSKTVKLQKKNNSMANVSDNEIFINSGDSQLYMRAYRCAD